MQTALTPDLAKVFDLIKNTQLAEADESLRSLMNRSPEGEGYPYAQMILASHQRRYAEAYKIGEGLLKISAGDPQLRSHQARNAIALGKWSEGLELFDSVRGFGLFGGDYLTKERPLWSGESLTGKTLLLATEGGIGDAVCFSRFTREFSRLGAKVILASYEPLFEILKTQREISALVDLSVAPKCEFDYWLPALSSPRLLKLDHHQIKGEPFLLAPNWVREKWARLVVSEKPKVGICWQGNPGFVEDYVRSIPGELFRDILSVEDLQFYKVQINEENNSFHSPNLTNLSGFVQNPIDLAGFLMQLDLFVTVDSGMAHMAGALGVPTILLNRVMGWFTFGHAPDHENLQTTPWYNSMRILHQKEWGRWEETLARLKKILAGRCWPRDSRTKEDKIYHPLNPLPARETVKYVDSRFGPFLTLPNDYFVGKAVDLYGEYSRGESLLFKALVEPGQIVVEAGGHIGAQTVVLAQCVGATGRVHAFEPQIFLNEILRKNVSLQSLTQVIVSRQGLAESPEKVSAPLVDYERVGNFGAVELLNFAEKSEEFVELIALDSLKLEKLHFLKMDIEGMELSALKGAEDTIRRCRPLLYVENDRPENTASVFEFIRGLGYGIWHHRPQAFHPENSKGNPLNIYEGVYFQNILAVPLERNPFDHGLLNAHGLERA